MAAGALKGWLLVILNYKSLQTLFTKRMEALQQFRLSVGVKTDTAGELVFQLLESFFSITEGCGHCGCDEDRKS